MIAIKECNPNISTIAAQHQTFVKQRVQSSILFYLELLEYLQQIAFLRTSDSSVRNKIEAIRKAHSCSHYKSLLNHLLKADIRIKKAEDSHLIITPRYRKTQVKNLTPIISGLKVLDARADFLLSVDFCQNPDRYIAAYEKIKKDCDGAKFLFTKIFDYDWFTDLDVKQPWGPYHLTEKIGLNTCAYCNRQYTFTVTRSGGKKIARPQLDHFLPQSEHTLLALNFYNLIPSCAVCNASVKGSIATSYHTHLNPYALNPKHELLRFSYQPKSYAASVGLSEELDIEIEYNGDPGNKLLKDRSNGNIALFCLKELYQNHADTVKDIILKREETNDQYIKMTQQAFSRLALSHEDAYRLAFGNYFNEKDFHKRPLAKLTKDIAVELGVLPKFFKKP